MEKMMLSPRLACLAALVPNGARLADVGTDHGKLPIALLREGRIAAAIASDISEGPLAHAAQNAWEHGVSLSLRLAADLDAVTPEECDTVSIAGMGGETIAEILSAAPWTTAGAHLLLLQPMTMVYELRQWLWANGYQIARETLCREERRQYVVLSVRGGAPKRTVPLPRCAVSEALCRAPGAAAYLEMLLHREETALYGMEKSRSADETRLWAQRSLVEELRRAWEDCI